MALNPNDAQKLKALTAAAAQVPAEVRALIGRSALMSQKSEEHWPYYSRIRLQALIAQPGGPGTPVTYSFKKGTSVRAFSYGIDKDMSSAGFASGTLATEADTNLIEGGKTKDGQELEITGIGCFILPLSEPRFVASVYQESSCKFVRAGGDEAQKIGSLMFLPSPGGLSGAAQSFAVQPNKIENHSAFGFITNGMPIAGSLYALPSPVYWTPSGERDSTLNFQVTIERDIAIKAVTPRLLGAPAEFIDLYEPPTTVGDPYTYVDLMVLLRAKQTQPRSKNR